MTENRLTGACIGTCKYLRPGPLSAQGQHHCIGCSMTEAQKDGFKPLPDEPAREAYLQMVRDQQLAMGGFEHWTKAYKKKCADKSAPLPGFLKRST